MSLFRERDYFMCKRFNIFILVLFLSGLSSNAFSGSDDLFLHVSGDFFNVVKPAGTAELYDLSGGASLGLGTNISKFNEIVLWFDYNSANCDSLIDGNKPRLKMYTLYLDFLARIPGSDRRIFVPYVHGGLGYTKFDFVGVGLSYPGDGEISHSDIIFRFGGGFNIETYSRFSVATGFDYSIVTGAFIGDKSFDDYRIEYFRINLGLIYQISEK